MKKNFLILLTFGLITPLLARAAPCTPCASDTVVMVVNPCNINQAFTIRVPVRMPAGITAAYEWYRNGMALPEAQGVTKSGGGVIAYTVPANSILSAGQEFYFLFRLSDDPCADCWDSSPLYQISWSDSTADYGCTISGGAIVGDTLNLCGANAGGLIQGESVPQCGAGAGGLIQGEAVQYCSDSAGGEIVGETAQHCSALSGGLIQGEAVQLCGAEAGGVINGQ